MSFYLCFIEPCAKLLYMTESQNNVERTVYTDLVTKNNKDYVLHGSSLTYTCKPRYEVTENVITDSLQCDNGTYVNMPPEPLCKASKCIFIAS